MVRSNPLHPLKFIPDSDIYLFLRKFHSVNPFNGNFCERGQAWFTEEKMEFSSQDVSKTYSILFSAKFKPISNPFRGRAP